MMLTKKENLVARRCFGSIMWLSCAALIVNCASFFFRVISYDNFMGLNVAIITVGLISAGMVLFSFLFERALITEVVRPLKKQSERGK